MKFIRGPAAACFVLAVAGTAAAQYPNWRHSGSVFLITTPEGANLPATATVTDFPVVVRLDRDFFDFSQARPGGEDLRFSTPGGEPLAYEIEQWDPAAGTASVWVRVPKIQGNAQQEIRLHWGQPEAASESDGSRVFNSANGYASVWHMSVPPQDVVGTLPSIDVATASTAGTIGLARGLAGGQGIFGGEKIPNYPAGASSHSSAAWFRAEKPNVTILGWGNEGGGRGSKVRMQLRSPPHIHIDSDFSDVASEGQLTLGEWTHVVHTYDREDGKIYINGRLAGSAKPPLDIKSPARLWIGGWYHNYDFVGAIDEVRISRVARSADWVRLEYENQRSQQTVVGPLVQPGEQFSVSPEKLTLREGETAAFTANAGGARKIYWVVKPDGQETVVATDRFSFTFNAGRVAGDQTVDLQCKAVYADRVKVQHIPITVREAIPDPAFTLLAPAAWDGRKTIEIVPQIGNLAELQASGAGDLHFDWSAAGLAVTQQVGREKLILTRAQQSGPLTVSVTIDNGGQAIAQTATIRVKEPDRDAWVERTPLPQEMFEDNQFFARDDQNQGTLYCRGQLADAADSVFLKLYADDKLVGTESQPVGADRSYSLKAKLAPGLIHYRAEFGTTSGQQQKILHAATNMVCGDVFLIDGQSNAEATDVGPEDPPLASEWVRSFGSMAGDPQNARLRGWGDAVVRDRNGQKAQIGYWGLALAKQLVENQKMPICILNGAVGGSRIDAHQRDSADPTNVGTIYGRLLWRVQAGRLTHGVRGVIWHQGENDQGADGPTGRYGWETYRQYFVDMAAGWKDDYPNVQHYYVFQIWPRACSMGSGGSDNKLREVQRTLPAYFSRLSVMSTLGIKPPGGCHYPIEGYAAFARLICPLIERDHYGRMDRESITAADLQQAYFADEQKRQIVLEFDQPMVWSASLASQFYLDGKAGQVAAGDAAGKQILLKLADSSSATRITYLDGAAWSPDNVLAGQNGIAALTFCDVPVLPAKAAAK